MEQIRLDPQPTSYAKRELRPAPEASDIFASLLDVKLKNSGDLRPASDADLVAPRPDTPGRGHRASPGGTKRPHQTAHNDRFLELRDSHSLKAMPAAEAQAAKRDHDGRAERRGSLAKDLPDGAPIGCGETAPLYAETGISGGESDRMPDQAAMDVQDHDGSPSGETGDNHQSEAEPSDPSAADTAAAPVSAAPQPTGQAVIGDEASVPAIPAPNAVSPEEARSMAQAALAAAATALPAGAFDTSAAGDAAEPGTSKVTGPASIAGSALPPVAVNDDAPPEAQPGLDRGLAIPIGKMTGSDSDSAEVVLRPAAGSAKAKAQATGQGTATAHVPTHQPDQNPLPRTAAGSSGGSDGESLGTEERGTTAGVGLGGEFEDADQSGLGGWSMHLAQGASGRRADFIANLRQHLQNLPAHEQVAVHIQRAVTDRLSKLTVELSPVELGRIQVRLKIDEENRVAAAVTVERAGTLELLQKDARALERVLQEAGLKTDSASLSFTLYGGEADDFGQKRAFGGPGGAARTGDGAATVADTKDPARPSVIATADGLVDVEV